MKVSTLDTTAIEELAYKLYKARSENKDPYKLIWGWIWQDKITYGVFRILLEKLR